MPRSFNSQRDNNFRLLTLGRLTLIGPDGSEDESLKNKRLKLALLAVLALARRPTSRDTLIGMFWGEQDEARARHSLSDALSHLRRVLGRDAIVAGKNDVELGEAARVNVDASELTDAVASGDVERACALYQGRFLETVYFAGGETFRNWVDGEQRRLEALFLKGCAEQCQALARARRWEETAELSARWLDAAPLSSDAALYLLNAVKAPGTRDADQRALAEFDRVTARLRDEFGRNPDRALAALARDITERLKVTDATGEFPTALPRLEPQKFLPRVEPVGILEASIAISAPTPSAPVSNPESTLAPRWSRSRVFAIAGIVSAALLVALAAFVSVRRFSDAATRDPRPSIAIAGVRDLRSDSSASWMAEGLTQMMASKLGRSAAVEVVAPDRVRDVKLRAQVERRAQLSLDELRDLGRRLGATWVVQGGLTGGRVGNGAGGVGGTGDSVLMLDVAVYDVATGRTVQSFVVNAPDILRLADVGAARLLEAAGANGPGPRLTDVETASLDAYEHFARFEVASSEGRMNDALRELDAAIALDSGFITALRERTSIALVRGDRDVVWRLGAAFKRYRARATEWDRLWMAIQEAFHGGERTKSVTLARQLVERYPRDPRAYALLAEILGYQGRFDEAARVYRQELALDSLATLAGRGICLPCQAYGGLAFQLTQLGDYAGALRATTRIVELQPELAAAWTAHASVLAEVGQFAGAYEALRRALALSGGDDAVRGFYARVLMAGRQLREADSVITALERTGSQDGRRAAFDLRMMLEREQGRYRASTATIHRMVATFPDTRELQLVEANNLGRIADYAAARRLYETLHHQPRQPGDSLLPTGVALVGDAARSFSWHHALEGDAVAPGGDTTYLRVLADSIEMVSARSYYERDARLHHHLRGLIAMQAGRYDDAAREFEAARYGRAGWTRTLVELAKAELARGQAVRALGALRDAYYELPDAMGRYAPRSEIDYWIAIAFRRAGQADSAAAYERYVRDAWANAEPEAKKLLADLDRGT